MTNCSSSKIEFSPLNNRKLEVEFTGGNISSDGGVVLLRQIDQRLKLTEKVASTIPDDRDPKKVIHSILSQLRQRVYGIALGYEDLNDHITLRHDTALQAAVGQGTSLASSSTLFRLDNKANRQMAINCHKAFFDLFIASHKKKPRKLILDFDATDSTIYGNQEKRAYHAYYRDHCFLPLYVYCGKQLLISYLRPSNQDGAKHCWAILSLLVKKLRQTWPKVKIIFRGDSGFNRHKMFQWCERKGIYYIVGQAKNNRLIKKVTPIIDDVAESYKNTEVKQKTYTSFYYGADTWNRERRIIGKIEHGAKGSNQRFLVTNLQGDSKYLYEKVYCARGDMENRIKEVQLHLFADRTSSHKWWSNQWRMLLSALAYVLIERMKVFALKGTRLATAYPNTIRLKLLKIGAIIIANTRRIRFLLPRAYPFKHLFMIAAKRLC